MDRPRQFAAGDAPLAHWFKTGTKTTGTKGGRGLTRRTRTLWQQPAFVAMAATILGRTEGTSRTAGLALRTVGPWRAARRAALVSGTRSWRDLAGWQFPGEQKTSKITESPGHGGVPDPFASLFENEISICRRSEPIIAC